MNNVILSGLFKLSWRDLGKGVVMAVFAGLLTYVSGSGVDLGHLDWWYLLKVVLTCVLSYLATQLVHDEHDKLGGVL